MSTSLADRIKEGSRAAHEEAETAPFIEQLMSGRLGVEALRDLQTQAWFIYAALEDAGRAMADDPVAGPFVDPGLARLPALACDLEYLHGTADWRSRIAALPATERYVARLTTAAHQDPYVFLAHHYTRYLGDLSGGQIVRRKMQDHFGLDARGLDFYRFAAIPKPKPYKDRYRRKLNELPVDATGGDRMVAEVIDVFALNSALFADLGRDLDRYCVIA